MSECWTSIRVLRWITISSSPDPQQRSLHPGVLCGLSAYELCCYLTPIIPGDSSARAGPLTVCQARVFGVDANLSPATPEISGVATTARTRATTDDNNYSVNYGNYRPKSLLSCLVMPCPLLALWGSGGLSPLSSIRENAFKGPGFQAFDDNSFRTSYPADVRHRVEELRR